MRRNDLNKIGILLIILSFICTGGGFAVYLVDELTVFNPPSAILGDQTGINISTVDGEGPDGMTSTSDSDGNTSNTTDKPSSDNNSNKDNNNNSNNNKPSTDKGSNTSKPEKPSGGGTSSSSGGSSSGNSSSNSGTSSGQGGGSSSGGSSSGGNTSTTTPTPTPEPTPEPEPAPTPTIEETNNNLRNSLQTKYGISIKYGAEVSGYNVGGMSTVTISDQNEIQKALNDMNATMSLYPMGIWKELKNAGYPLTIILIKQYSSANVTGITASYSNRVEISIATKFSFGETFNHEVFHYFENFITNFKGANFNNWNSFNPSDFTYGSVNSSLSYNRTYSADSYFVNDYAQTEAAEDRASTFEYMMFASKASCLNNGKPVWSKAKHMADQLDYYLNSVSPYVKEYWERHL